MVFESGSSGGGRGSSGGDSLSISCDGGFGDIDKTPCLGGSGLPW